MEEIEVPTEHLHEAIEEKAKEHETGWSTYVAISTALVAVLAALAGLMAGHHSNEALIDQIKASDKWAFFQAKAIKSEIKQLAIGADTAAIAKKYKDEQVEISKDAKEYEESSEAHLSHHIFLARSVTLFQIAIAISAIAILTKRKSMWFVGLAFSAIGIVFFILGLIF